MTRRKPSEPTIHYSEKGNNAREMLHSVVAEMHQDEELAFQAYVYGLGYVLRHRGIAINGRELMSLLKALFTEGELNDASTWHLIPEGL
jgi:hypothetical protein